MKKTLFVSFDGLADPLGQSQIVPYINYISKLNHKMYVLSVEKKNRLQTYNNIVDNNLKNKNIIFKNLLFSKNKNKLSRVIDTIKLFFQSLYIIKKYNIDIIHIRGFIPAIPILVLRYFIKFRIIYDSRGLWVDERVDNGSINLQKFSHIAIYKILKKLENKIFIKSDKVIVLTRKAKRIIKTIDKSIDPVVIPCCADYDHFKFLNIEKSKIKKKFDIPANKKIILYSGSLRGVYLFKEMLNFFEKINSISNDFIFLIVTNDLIYANNILANLNKNNIILINDTRENMPKYYYVSDILLCFINASFARQCSSPTKIAEALACNIPLICNKGVGDIDLIVKKLNAGLSIDLLNIKYNKKLLNKILNLIDNNNTNRLRNESQKYFDLEFAYKNYKLTYSNMLK
tara:strand:- start:6202 stop:7404 length:1203 start_codon:yes stop_codon:yes gene_type:complete